MARKARVKCPFCEEYFYREDEKFVQTKNRYYHEACFIKMNESIDQEQKDLIILEEYIMKLFGATFISALQRKQIKQMREQYNFSYSGITKSLTYFYEIKGNSIEKANGGIGIVPYIYNDARTYYYNMHLAHQKNENKNIDDYVIEGRTIVIKSPKLRGKKKRLFNMEEEIDGE